MKMLPCLSGAGRPYTFDLEIVTPSTSSSITSQTSSPSSTLSESSNSPHTISTRKSRTPRKRPNQTYNEAATLFSTACPNIFSPKQLLKPFKFSKPYDHFVGNQSADLLLPFRVFDNSGYLIHQPIAEKPHSRIEPRFGNFSREISSLSDSSSNYLDEFYPESILDDESEEGGIDSIMGKLSVGTRDDEPSSLSTSDSCYGYPVGLGFGGFSRAFRHVDDGEWWKFPQIDVVKISPKLINKKHIVKKKKKVEKGSELKCLVSPQPHKENQIVKQENDKLDVSSNEQAGENSDPKPSTGLLLKLNIDEVANAWSDRGSPFSDEARLALIDLFSDTGVREASVLRYKEKRRTRLFSKKIRYQVRKVNADQRPRMKGRFVRRPDSP